MKTEDIDTDDDNIYTKNIKIKQGDKLDLLLY